GGGRLVCPRAGPRAPAAEAPARRKMGVDSTGGPRRAAARGRAALRRDCVVRAAVVGSSDRPARASRDRIALGRAFQRSVDRQPVRARLSLATAGVGAGGSWRVPDAPPPRGLGP